MRNDCVILISCNCKGERVADSSTLAEYSIKKMDTFNTSRASGRTVKRAFIDSKLFQIFLESPYCKHGKPWGYDDIEGPGRWPISFPQCEGKYQTPIDSI